MQHGGVQKFENFWSEKSELFVTGSRDFMLEPIIHQIKREWSNVTILNFEELRKDPRKFIKVLAEELSVNYTLNHLIIKQSKSRLTDRNQDTSQNINRLYQKLFIPVAVREYTNKKIIFPLLQGINGRNKLNLSSHQEAIMKHYYQDWRNIQNLLVSKEQ